VLRPSENEFAHAVRELRLPHFAKLDHVWRRMLVAGFQNRFLEVPFEVGVGPEVARIDKVCHGEELAQIVLLTESATAM